MNASTGPSNARKRLLSIGDESFGPTQRKRARASSISVDFQQHLMGASLSISSGLDRLPRTRVIHRDDVDFLGMPAAPTLSHSSSFTMGSRGCSPGDIGDQPGSSAFISRSGMALMRSVSSASLSTTSTASPSYSEASARFNLRNTKFTIDYSAPSPPPTDPLDMTPPLGCSVDNIVFFGRGNRVHYKNLTVSEEVGQLCKLQNGHGDLRIIECGGPDQPDVVALATSKGFVQLWDIKSKKTTASWTIKGVTAMRWNGPVLTIGGLKGTIRHYDTRISPTPKMKEQARKVTRHQSRITSLEWNMDGKILASGDQAGMIYCWDSRNKVPLDVGEFVQRRKKMQHAGAISALSWCTWQSKLLASGDNKGTIQVWSASTTNAVDLPGKLELGAPVTGLHFASACKELLSTHGSLPAPAEAGAATTSQTWPRINMANTIVVHSYPSLRHVTTLSLSGKPIANSVLIANGTKLVVALPEENKINVCDVWCKKKELRRQTSFRNSTIR